METVRLARLNASPANEDFGVGRKLGSLGDLKTLGFEAYRCLLFARGIANARRRWEFANGR